MTAIFRHLLEVGLQKAGVASTYLDPNPGSWGAWDGLDPEALRGGGWEGEALQ